MVMSKKQFIIIFIFIAGIIACNKNVVDEVFAFVSPKHFPKPAYNFDNNEITKARFELGRKLFYDPILSANNTISCGSCHIQTSAFTHHGHILSHGIYDRQGTRNSPPIMNLAWNTSFMWDGGIVDLDLQPIAPIKNHVEMDETMPNVIDKLNKHSQYPTLFKNAFGSSTITGANFLKALSQFMVMCVSSNSKYDSVQLVKASFTTTETQGYQVFQQKCSSCHKEPLFTDYSFRNNGLTPSLLNDLGRYEVTNQETDKYTFKVPSLRNLSYTAPYMHDGRLLTLDAVLDHYTTNFQATQNLDPLLQNGISLTTSDKINLLAFLKTLDDKSFLLDKRFSEQ
jgi:cytochrome c peroxidase